MYESKIRPFERLDALLANATARTTRYVRIGDTAKFILAPGVDYQRLMDAISNLVTHFGGEITPPQDLPEDLTGFEMSLRISLPGFEEDTQGTHILMGRGDR